MGKDDLDLGLNAIKIREIVLAMNIYDPAELVALMETSTKLLLPEFHVRLRIERI